MSKNLIPVIEYNPNMTCRNAKKSKDSMIRSICKVTNLDWEEVYNRLCKRGLEMGCMPDCTNVVVKEFGFKLKDKCRLKVKKFIKKHQVGIFILVVGNYAFPLTHGAVWDADSINFEKEFKNCKVDKYFIIEDE